MQLLGVRIVGLGPFEDVTLPFCDVEAAPRFVTVLHGGGGVGKTTVLSAIAATRPGHAVVPQSVPREPLFGGEPVVQSTSPTCHVVCDWLLGQDDPNRPHVLRVATPNIRLSSDDEVEALRRREQVVFDKLAREGGFAFLAISSSRWFARQAVTLSAPSRTMARHDVRTTAGLDDASRSDLARETKQTLAYAEIAAALSVRRERGSNPPSTSPPLLAAQRGLEVLARAMRSAVDALVAPAGFSYAGLDESSFEPVFEALGRRVSFDGLPTRVRHLVAFAALPVRALWSAYPGRDPRLSEGVVLIDEVDLQQDPGVQASLVGALRTALPRVQWILTTTSPAVAGSCDTLEVLALRRSSEVDRIELFVGSEARTH